MGGGCVAAGGRRAIVKEFERERKRDGEMKSVREEGGEGGKLSATSAWGGKEVLRTTADGGEENGESAGGWWI